MVDTCAAEFEAATPYFYSTYEQENEALAGAGQEGARHRQRADPHRPGHRVRLLLRARRLGAAGRPATARSWPTPTRRPSPPTSTPPTASTSNRSTRRRVRDLLENEAGDGGEAPRSIVQFGGQTAINLAEPLARARRCRSSAPVAEAIDLAEDRRRFEAFLTRARHPAAARRRRARRSRRRCTTAEAHRLPGAGAPQLRARRPRDGDRAERRPSWSRYVAQAAEAAERQADPHRQVPRGHTRSRSTRSATASAC